MTKQDIIKIAHEAQADAGSLISFNQKVTDYMHSNFTNKADPVAAFLGALIAIDDSAFSAVQHMDFYFSELQRVKNAFDILPVTIE